MTRGRKRFLTGVAAILAVAAVAVTVSLCTGAGEAGAGTDSVPPTPGQVLEQPPHYDERTLDDYAAAVREGRTDFDNNALARMIMLCQASVDRLGSMVDVLVANDDPGDSYNTLTEIGSSAWVHDTSLLLRFLRTHVKETDMLNRLGQLASSCVRIRTSVNEICRDQLGGSDLHLALPQ